MPRITRSRQNEPTGLAGPDPPWARAKVGASAWCIRLKHDPARGPRATRRAARREACIKMTLTDFPALTRKEARVSCVCAAARRLASHQHYLCPTPQAHA